MKKNIAVLCLIISLILTGCYSRYDLIKAREDGYQAGYDRGYLEAMFGTDTIETEQTSSTIPETTEPPLIAVTKPYSGTILRGQEPKNEYLPSTLTVNADSDQSYVVSLKDRYGGHQLSFFVKAGESATVVVPSTRLYVYFASGKTWYGYGEGKMFGENTVYTKDDDLLDFNDGQSWEYTLYPVSNGNFQESPSSAEEFF